MPRLVLFCLLSSQLAVTAVVARQLPAFLFVDGGASIADAPSAAADASRLHVHSLLESGFAGSPLASSHHGPRGPFDRHFAGGKIILGGLAAAIVAAVFCYIRITKAKKIIVAESKS